MAVAINPTGVKGLVSRAGQFLGGKGGGAVTDSEKGHKLLSNMVLQMKMTNKLMSENKETLEDEAKENKKLADALSALSDTKRLAIQEKILDRQEVSNKEMAEFNKLNQQVVDGLGEIDSSIDVNLKNLTDNTSEQLMDERNSAEDRQDMLTNLVGLLEGQGVQSQAFDFIKDLQNEGLDFEEDNKEQMQMLTNSMMLLAHDAGKLPAMSNSLNELNELMDRSVFLQTEFNDTMEEEFEDGESFREKLLKNASAFTMGDEMKGGLIQGVLSMFPGGAEVGSLIAPQIGSMVGGISNTVGKGLSKVMGGMTKHLGPLAAVAATAVAAFKLGEVLEEKFIGGKIGDFFFDVFGGEQSDEEMQKEIDAARQRTITAMAEGKVEAVDGAVIAQVGGTPLAIETAQVETTPLAIETADVPQTIAPAAEVQRERIRAENSKSATVIVPPTSGDSSIRKGTAKAPDRKLAIDDIGIAATNSLMFD